MAGYPGGNWPRHADYYGDEEYFYEPEDDIAAMKRRTRRDPRLMHLGATSRRMPGGMAQPNMGTTGYGFLGQGEPSYLDIDMPNRMRVSPSPMAQQNGGQYEHHHHHHHYVYNCGTPSTSTESVPRQIECRSEHFAMPRNSRRGGMMRPQGLTGPGATGSLAMAGAARQPGLYHPGGRCSSCEYDCYSSSLCPACASSYGRASIGYRGPQAGFRGPRMLGP